MKALAFIKELRAPFFTATVVPVLLGGTIAFSHGIFHIQYFLLALIGAIFLHAGTNVINDYFDFLSKDDLLVEIKTPFSGGSGILPAGLLKPKEVFIFSLILFLIGSIIGLYLTFVRGAFILLIGVVAVFSGIFYSAPPVSLANRGIGELFVGLNFGPLCALGSYYVLSQEISFEPIYASIPVGILIATVLYINEFPDYSADKQVGKRHLVVRLGKEKAVRGYALLFLVTYLFIFAGVIIKILPMYSLLAMATAPYAVKAVKIAKKYYEDTVNLIPAMGLTIRIHLLTGLLLSISYLLEAL
ncbi:MAG: prenyltransferase [Candidatus Hydrothermarchaeota archaeon]